MPMLRTVILDDDVTVVATVEHFVENTKSLSLLKTFTNPIKAVNYIKEQIEDIDLLVLDVEMPEMSGLDLIEMLDRLPHIIIITSKEEYALQAFQYNVRDFLVKPLSYPSFLKAVEKVSAIAHRPIEKKNPYLFVRENTIVSKVSHKDIVWFEALGDYVRIFCTDGSYTANTTMKNLERTLEGFNYFIRVHRSYIINIDHINSFDYNIVIVGKNNKLVPIGNTYRKPLLDRLDIV